VTRTLTNDKNFMELIIPGRKVNIIFSVCHIGKFSETTDCLQDEIIVFVNKIVKIVHECAKRWGGNPANNNGDRYILTWKLPSRDDLNKKMNRSNSIKSLPSLDDISQIVPDMKLVKPYAPWLKEKDEIEEFEDLRESNFE
jgi:hypothetical protein